MKKLFASLAIALTAALTGSPVAAYVWVAPNGVMYSDTCVAPTGHYMTFANRSGPVGGSCFFRFQSAPGVTFYGVWG